MNGDPPKRIARTWTPYFRGARARRTEARMPVHVRIFFLSLSVVASASSVFAQTTGTPLTGVVVDPAGRSVPRAVVQIVAPGGATAATVLTDGDGAFRVAH